MTDDDSQPIQAVVHIDIQPQFHDEGERRLIEFVKDTEADENVDVFELLREDRLDNHYMLVSRFPSRASYVRFVQSTYVKAMRDELGQWLGSPWDERPATRVDQPQT